MLHSRVVLDSICLVDFLAPSRESFFDSFSIDRVSLPVVDPSVSATACSGTLKRLPLLVIISSLLKILECQHLINRPATPEVLKLIGSGPYRATTASI